jgi:hypothetical protein
MSNGTLLDIWLERSHGGPMDPVAEAVLDSGEGLRDNANRGGKRQVTAQFALVLRLRAPMGPYAQDEREEDRQRVTCPRTNGRRTDGGSRAGNEVATRGAAGVTSRALRVGGCVFANDSASRTSPITGRSRRRARSPRLPPGAGW